MNNIPLNKLSQNLNQLVNECVNKHLSRYLREDASHTLNNTQYLYHATPSCYISSIKKHGLGGRIPRIRFWDYEGTPYEKITQGCFLSTDEYVAESYVECSELFEELADAYEERYDKELEIAVFRIDINDLDINLLSVDTNQQRNGDDVLSYFYNGVIPFSKLTRIELY